jgi:hypothetical protein
MKLIVEIDLDDNSCRILSKKSLTKEDIVSIVLNYFNLTLDEIIAFPLLRKMEHVLCRRFISYYLVSMFKLEHSEIMTLLGYTGRTNIIWYNKNRTELQLKHKDPQYIRSFNNLNRIIEGFTR